MPKSCAAVGCTNHSMMQKPGLTFHIFPDRKKRREKWEKWVKALKRVNADGTPWYPNGNYVYVCCEHFISGRPTKDVNHPDFIPSVFKYRGNEKKRGKKLSVYENLEKTEPSKVAYEELSIGSVVEIDQMESTNDENVTEKEEQLFTTLKQKTVDHEMEKTFLLEQQASPDIDAEMDKANDKDMEVEVDREVETVGDVEVEAVNYEEVKTLDDGEETRDNKEINIVGDEDGKFIDMMDTKTSCSEEMKEAMVEEMKGLMNQEIIKTIHEDIVVHHEASKEDKDCAKNLHIASKEKTTELEKRQYEKREMNRLLMTSKVYQVVVNFLQDIEGNPHKKRTLSAWCSLLRAAGAKGPIKSLRKALLEAVRKFGVKPFAGRLYLYCKNTHKLIAAKDEMPQIIMDAHIGSGLFKNYRRKNDASDKVIHNDVKKTFLLIQSLFTLGGKHYGFQKLSIYRQVIHCNGCDFQWKGVNLSNSTVKRLEQMDPDFWNEQKFMSLKDAPLSMAISGPSKSSVWFDQQGLAREKILFMKLIGVITEIGIEVQKAVQGDQTAKERLLTKICCGEKLIHDMKANTKVILDNGSLSMEQFIASYNELEEEYKDIGRLDLYIYDMNLLLFLYKLSNTEELTERINLCIQRLRNGKNCSLKVFV